MSNALVVYANSGDLHMIVLDATNPNDPAWNPSGHVTVSLARATYDQCATDLDIMNASQSLVNAASLTVGLAVQSKINAIVAANTARNVVNVGGT